MAQKNLGQSPCFIVFHSFVISYKYFSPVPGHCLRDSITPLSTTDCKNSAESSQLEPKRSRFVVRVSLVCESKASAGPLDPSHTMATGLLGPPRRMSRRFSMSHVVDSFKTGVKKASVGPRTGSERAPRGGILDEAVHEDPEVALHMLRLHGQMSRLA